MNRLFIILSVLTAWLLGLVSCVESSKITEELDAKAEAVPLRGIRAVIVGSDEAVTRSADTVLALIDSIGRYTFAQGDELHFTNICRTVRPIEEFTYKDIVHFQGTVSGEGASQGVSWTQTSPAEDDIYWSDGHSPHTFTGYMLPHADGETAAQSGFDWMQTKSDGHLTFYGSIGAPAVDNGMIDYTCTPGADQKDHPYSTEKLRKEDLLLTHDIDLRNEDAVAVIRLHHALSSIRVTVTITGFASTADSPDAESRVTNMVLHNQPVMYRWLNDGYDTTQGLSSADQSHLNALYGSNPPQWNMKKEMKLWQPREYHGADVRRTFLFYGIVVPGPRDEVSVTFDVTYPDPLNPEQKVTKEYTATLQLSGGEKIRFDAGYCTSINVNLNHKNEKITVGAEYMSWQYVEAPDQSSLRKKSTFLSSTARTGVTIHTDAKATADDATWLYFDQTSDAAVKPIIDIYGNDGSKEQPYTITSADELLSFAYEVNNGFSFEGKSVKLDANLYLQKNTSSEDINWIGIGTDTYAFNGELIGGSRSIKRLKGNPLFVNIGPKGRIGSLSLEEVVGIESGGAAFAQKNQGILCGCAVASGMPVSYTDSDGNVMTKPGTFEIKGVAAPSGSTYSGTVAGPLVAVNTGVVFACHSQGRFSTDASRVGGLVGYNAGDIVASYAAVRALSDATSPFYRGIVAYNEYAPEDLPAGKGEDEYGRIIYSFFDKTIASNVEDANTLENVHGMTTVQMQASGFIGSRDSDNTNTLNGSINSITAEKLPKAIKDAYGTTGITALLSHFHAHYYVHQVAGYPKIY